MQWKRLKSDFAYETKAEHSQNISTFDYDFFSFVTVFIALCRFYCSLHESRTDFC